MLNRPQPDKAGSLSANEKSGYGPKILWDTGKLYPKDFTVAKEVRLTSCRESITASITTDYLDAPQAAELLHISIKTIYQWVWRRRIPAYKPHGRGGKLLFRRDELIAWIESGRQATAAELDIAATACQNNPRAQGVRI